MLEHVLGRREALAEELMPAIMIALGMGLLFVAFFDQGQILSAFMGSSAARPNYLHEFFHDGRHVLGAPCH